MLASLLTLLFLSSSTNGTDAPVSAPQSQSSAAASDTPTDLEDVVVEGRSLRTNVERFVDDIIAAPVGRGPARWEQDVCVGVVNLRRDAAQVIVDRVSMAAADVGLKPGQPGCRPNILIMATDDGSGLAKAVVQARPTAFRPGYAGGARGSNAIMAFESTSAAVRWWHMSVPVNEMGEIAVRLPGDAQAPFFFQNGSRLTTEAV